jgi:hypothetical protein
MTLKKWTGTNLGFTEHNTHDAESLTLNGLNHIRQLIDRAGVYSKGLIDLWGEAYVDANGRNNSIASATAFYNIDGFYYIPFYTDIADAASPADTFHDFSSNVISQYSLSTVDEHNGATLVPTPFAVNTGAGYMRGVISISGGSTNGGNGSVNAAYGGIALIPNQMGMTVEITFSASLVNGASNTRSASATIYINGVAAWTGSRTNSNGTTTITDYKLKLEPITSNSYKTWLDTGAGYTDTGNKTISGEYFTIQFTAYVSNDDNGTASSTLDIKDIKYNKSPQVSIITHTIPAGTFSPTINKAIGIALMSEWETGADIKYKLTNAGEDTGWLNCGVTPEVSSFAAFTSEPTSLIVQITPKSSSPTVGYPRIKGFVVRTTN